MIQDMVLRTLIYPVGNHVRRAKKMRLRFLSDVHFSSQSCDRKLLRLVLKRWSEDNEDCYYFSCGDLQDFASTSERMRMAGVHETTIATFDELVYRQIRELASECEFMRGSFVGAVDGNHNWIFNTIHNGLSADQVFAEEMGGHWLGGIGLVRLQAREGRVDVAIKHGHGGGGGGKRVGAGWNRVEDFSRWIDADIYVMGHNHQVGGVPAFDRIELAQVWGASESPRENAPIRRRSTVLCQAGTFNASHEVGKAGYATKAGYAPTTLGALEVGVEFRRVTKSKDGGRDDMTNVVIVPTYWR